MKTIRTKPIHPFLLAAYPILALLGSNAEEVKFLSGIRVLALSILVSAGIFLLLNTLLKNRLRAGLLTSLFLVLFFSYGHIYFFLESNPVGGFSLGRHRLLAPLWLGLAVFSIWRVLRWKGDLSRATYILNVITILLLVFPSAQIVIFGARSLSASTNQPERVAPQALLRPPTDEQSPDIYYIILDAYGRDDTLLLDFDYDNRPFLEDLRKLGFYVALCSQSNYSQTQLSLASSLNSDYLQTIGEELNPDYSSRAWVRELILHSVTRTVLENTGYTSVAFETGFKGTEWKDADIYLAPGSGNLAEAQLLGGLNDFEVMLLRTSAVLALIDGAVLLPQYLQPDFNNLDRIQYERVSYVLDQLSRMPALSSPKLVFAHLVIPHPPYVFEPDGSFVDYEKPDDPGYPDQITFLNRTLLPLLKSIIQTSESSPVVILQADHGAIHSPPEKRLNIFNAYYLPGGGNNSLYENISPVNTFRVIFNQYFGGELPLLQDASYYSAYSRPYEFRLVPNDRPGCP